MLKGTDVNVCSVIGFPLGANTPEIKAYEAKNAVENGATEVDTVINIAALKEKMMISSNATYERWLMR